MSLNINNILNGVIQWNCRGLKANIDELHILISKYTPSAICLQETKLADTYSNYTIRGYDAYHCHGRGVDGTSGGSTILISKNFPHRQIPLNTNLQAVAVRITLHQRPTTLCSIYLPPDSLKIKTNLYDLIDQLPTPFILMGDFNAHNPLWGKSLNRHGKFMENLLDDYNLSILNDNSPTYIDSRTAEPSILDLTITQSNTSPDYIWSVLESLHGSDHYPTVLSDATPDTTPKPRHWKFTKAKWNDFQEECKTRLTTEKVDNMEEFQDTLVEIAKSHIPQTTTSHRKDKPWFNDTCKRSIQDRENAFNTLKKYPNHENLFKYKQQKALTRKIVRENKRKSWRDYTSKINNRTPISKIFKMIKKIKGRDSKQGYKHVKREDGEFAEEIQDIANTIGQSISKNSSSQHYTPIFQKNKRITESTTLDFSTRETLDYNKPFNLQELESCLAETGNTAAGPDQIHNNILKQLPQISKQCLLNTLNKMWLENSFPDSWRNANIIPIPKPNKDHTDPSNYRPIALTSCLCKLMEKMANKRLNWFLETNECLSDYQCGFRKGRSTNDHLVRLETFIRETFQLKQHIVAIFFDLEKAFDTTWKHGILRDIHNLGLRGNLPIFIENYLKDRTFQIKLGTSLSDTFEQEEGVPQGGILSPTLFNIKINSITNNLRQNVDCSLYVDDFLICYRAENMRTIERQLQLQLDQLQTWADAQGFKFSPTKTCAVHFCRQRKQHNDPELFIDRNHQIPVKKEAKFLGVTFDQKLTFLPHIKNLRISCQKAMSVIKSVSGTDWGGDRKSLLHLYRTLIRPRLDYGCIVYGSARKSYLQMLDPIHHQGLRLALGAFRTTPCESLYVEANECSLNDRRDKLAMQYSTKLASNPQNPAFKSTLYPKLATEFQKCEKSIPPLGLRVKPLLEQAKIDIEDIEINKPSNTAPWILKKPKVILDLTNHLKKDTPAYIYKEHLGAILDTHKNIQTIYTDGSKDEKTVGSASFSRLGDKCCGLNPNASIFTAECNAIEMALSTVDRSPQVEFMILSDSLSALLDICNLNLKNQKIKNIIHRYNQLSDTGKSIHFCWIPGHMGICGNEKADELAKVGLELEPTDIPIPHSDYKTAINKFILLRWQDRWSRQGENKLFQIQNSIGLWPCAMQQRRRDEIVLARIRMGHTQLTHSYIVKGENPPECFSCADLLTVEHIMMKCVDFSNIRRKYFRCRSLKKLFDLKNPQIILSYLKEIKLYEKI